MIKIDYPPYKPKIKTIEGKEFIFDEIRKQWILLMPEEWVRQNFLQYLIHVKGYPSSLIAIEKEIRLVDLTKRFDIVVYDYNAKPWMIVECKEMKETLNEKVLHQVLRYNISLKVSFIVITNGSFCYGFTGTDSQFLEIDELPAFPLRQ
ncbi:MAG: type I restriction enzyme HsdR N-terminal domain-containing protein [Ferruginibacter sp.]